MIKKKHLLIEAVKNLLDQNNPRLIFIIGKTCTGKSTFAKSLDEQNYKHLELDYIVLESVIKKFKLSDRDKAFSVYKGIANSDWQNSFETAVRSLIEEELKKSKIIVDAAFADPSVLKRVIPSEDESNFALIYFHPFDVHFYYQGILNRFMIDVKTKSRSFPIWDRVTEEILDDFKIHGEKGTKLLSFVRKYGDESVKKSVERFEIFEKVFPEIILTGY